jgi:plastocyanin
MDERHARTRSLLGLLLGFALLGLPGVALAQDQGQAAQPGGNLPGDPAIELRVRAGVTVRLTLENDPVEHNFALYESGDAEEAIFVGELFSGPGAERVYEFQAPEEPGEYFYRCDPHAELMTGTLIVR